MVEAYTVQMQTEFCLAMIPYWLRLYVSGSIYRLESVMDSLQQESWIEFQVQILYTACEYNYGPN